MATFKDIDLRANADAATYVKDEIVEVIFAQASGALQSREGLNHYSTGDALIAGSTGDHWSVSRARFISKYVPLAPTLLGENGRYSNIPLPVLAMQVVEDFSSNAKVWAMVLYVGLAAVLLGVMAKGFGWLK